MPLKRRGPAQDDIEVYAVFWKVWRGQGRDEGAIEANKEGAVEVELLLPSLPPPHRSSCFSFNIRSTVCTHLDAQTWKPSLTHLLAFSSPDDATHASLLALLPPSPPSAAAAPTDSMDVDASSTPLVPSAANTTPPSPSKPKKEPTEIGAEVDIYFRLLVVLVLIDSKQVEQVSRELYLPQNDFVLL